MYEFLDYRVCDAMTEPPVTIGPDLSIADAEALLEQRDFNAVPVVDDEGRLAGVFTKLDLLKAFGDIDGRMFTPYDEIMRKPVSGFMTAVPHVASATPRTPLTKVLEKLLALGVKSLPVVDDEVVVGIIAREDVLRALRRAVAGESPSEPI